MGQRFTTMPKTLAEVLTSYGTTERNAIANTHRVTKRDSESLAEIILDEEELRQFALCAQTDELDAFAELVQSQERISPELVNGELDYFLLGGYCGIWNEESTRFYITEDVAKQFEKLHTVEFTADQRRVETIGIYCHGANNLYAITPPGQVAKLFNQYEPDKITEEEIRSVYPLLGRYRCNFVLQDDLFIDENLLEEKRYLDLYERQQNSPFFLPSKEEIQYLAKYDQTEITQEMHNAARYLTEALGMPQKQVQAACSMVQIVIRKGGRMEDVLDILKEYGVKFESEEQLDEFGAFLVDVWNHSRMVLNRGYTPAEMQEFE